YSPETQRLNISLPWGSLSRGLAVKGTSTFKCSNLTEQLIKECSALAQQGYLTEVKSSNPLTLLSEIWSALLI
ncbi:MAG TPA: hypothetical protein VN150_11550, partial [Ochrobactrum sp.]|nr:hypothetical protein [Ochrobactrum sp.]